MTKRSGLVVQAEVPPNFLHDGHKAVLQCGICGSNMKL